MLFCVSKKGWGFDNFLKEVNTGKGWKVGRFIRPYVTYVLPLAIFLIFMIGIVTFEFADGFTLLSWVKGWNA